MMLHILEFVEIWQKQQKLLWKCLVQTFSFMSEFPTLLGLYRDQKHGKYSQ